MNANELADELQACFTKADWEHVDEAATMLRQQQAEIKALKGGFFDWSGFKELTDEEIKQIFQEQTGFYFDDNPADDLALMDFARAILRKAQEK